MSKYECKKKKKTKKKTWSMRKPLKTARNHGSSSRSDAKRNGSPLAANLTTDPIGDEHVSLEKNEGKTRGG